MEKLTAAQLLAQRRLEGKTALDINKDYSFLVPGLTGVLPYDPRITPQVKGRIDETAMAKERGARLHPMSGAGSIKDDFSTEDTVFEVKSVKSSHTLKGSDLLGLFKRATKQGKTAEYIIQFGDARIEATITFKRTRA